MNPFADRDPFRAKPEALPSEELISSLYRYDPVELEDAFCCMYIALFGRALASLGLRSCCP